MKMKKTAVIMGASLVVVAAGIGVGLKPLVSANPKVELFQSIAPSILSQDELLSFYWQAEKTDLAWNLIVNKKDDEPLSPAMRDIGIELASSVVNNYFKEGKHKEIVSLEPLLTKRGLFDEKFKAAVYEAKFQIAIDEANSFADKHNYKMALMKLSPFKNYSKLKGDNAKVLLGWKQEINNMNLYEKAKTMAKKGQYAKAIDTFNAIRPPFYYYEQAFKTAKTWEVAYNKQVAAEAARRRNQYYRNWAYEAAERGNAWMGTGNPIHQTSTWRDFMNGNF